MKEELNTTHTSNPEKAYTEELKGKSGRVDTNPETAARDAAKIEKVHSGHTQKIDSVDESDFNNAEDETELLKRENEREEND